MLATVPMDRDLALLMLRDIARVKVARVKTAALTKEAIGPLALAGWAGRGLMAAGRHALPAVGGALASGARRASGYVGRKVLQHGGGRLARFMSNTPGLRSVGERLGGRVAKSMFKNVDRMKQIAKGGRAVQSAKAFQQPIRTAIRGSKAGQRAAASRVGQAWARGRAGASNSRLGKAFALGRKRAKFRQANKLKWKAKDLQARTTKGFEGKLPSQLRATGKGKRMSLGPVKGRANVPLSGGGFRQSGSLFGNKFQSTTKDAITPSNAMESIKSMVMNGSGSKGGKAVRAAKFVAGNAASTLPFAVPGLISGGSPTATSVAKAGGGAVAKATKPATAPSNKYFRA